MVVKKLRPGRGIAGWLAATRALVMTHRGDKALRPWRDNDTAAADRVAMSVAAFPGVAE